MNYPITYSYQGKEATVYRHEQAWWDGQRCYEVEADGEPETWFGDPQHVASVGDEYPSILDLQELPGGHWVAHYLPNTTWFPESAAALDEIGAWAKGTSA